MKFRILSDVHGEFMVAPFTLPIMDDEANTVLLLAGDIGVASKPSTYMPFIKEMSERFLYIVHIAGNHEFYGSSFILARSQINQQYRDAGLQHKVGMFEREVVEFDDVHVICATLWSDMDGENPISVMACESFMNDYRKIATGTHTENPRDAFQYMLKPQDTLFDFKTSRDFIFTAIENAKAANKRVIVMTHHAPTHMSISPQFRNSPANGAFVSDLSEEIIEAEYDMLWVHGHVHQPHDYSVGHARVICNPHGYGDENPQFNNRLVLDI